MTTDTIVSLYQSGAFAPAILLALYLLLRWGSTSVPWLEVPNRAHYVAIVLTGLAIVAPAAAAGKMPDLALVVTAVGAMATMIMPGLTASPAKTSQGGFVRLGVMLSIIAIVVACSSAQKAAWTNLLSCSEDAAVQELEPTVESILKSGVASWKEQLAALAGRFGMDELTCAVSFVRAIMTSKMSAAPGGAVARADEWLKEHAK